MGAHMILVEVASICVPYMYVHILIQVEKQGLHASQLV